MPFSIKLLCVLLALAALFSLPVQAADLGVSAKSAILIDADSRRVIWQKNADARLPMASTTKIMTALTALAHDDPAREVRIPREAVGIEGSSIYLCEGEILTLEELLYALLLSSANDAATAIAIAVAGSVEAFAALMNETAKALGLTDSHFTNPHGLDDKEHYTTARDLAHLTAYALQNEHFARLVSTYKRTISLCGEADRRLLVNHNKLLRRYEGAIGVKTGFTKRSGRCLVSAARREEVTLVAVTLSAPDDWNDHTRMLDYGFSAYESVTLAETGAFCLPLPVVNGKESHTLVSNTQEIRVTLPRARGEVSYRVELDRFVYAPVTSGCVVGRVLYLYEGEVIGRSPLAVLYEVETVRPKLSLWDKILLFFRIKKGYD